MAMDALNNITNHVPNWLTRLDDLSGQIEKRQAELAAIDTTPDKHAETRSLRNKGSQESLKPADDGPSFIHPPADEPVAPLGPAPISQLNKPATPPPATSEDVPRQKLIPTSPGAGGLPSSHKPARDAIAAASSRARAQVKKRSRSTSVISAEGGHTTAYRTRSMIIVYYDSYVQSFFDELVRYISSGRNFLRKAKMAARVAQIKKLAEVDTSNKGEDGEDSLPSLRYMSSRRFGGMTRPGFGPPGVNDKPDIYDILDKGLEYVQSTCEHGAHQFLRDADCNEEIKKIQSKLREVLNTAKEETERINREEPELAQETGELNKARTHRPVSMRKELSACVKEKDSPAAVKEDAGKTENGPRSTRSKSSFIEPATSALEVDPVILADDSMNIEYDIPRIQYRSTRNMRYRAGA